MKTFLLSDICQIEIGRTPARANPLFWEGEHPWLSIADMGKHRDIYTTKECITDLGAKTFNGRLVEPGTLLFSFKLSIGKIGIARVPLYTNEAIAALHIKDKSLACEDYLYYALQGLNLDKKTDRAVMGKTLNKRKLAQVNIPLPPLEEQKRIAAILDKADAVRRKRKEAIALTEELLRSTFLDMFGDLATNPKGWKKGKLNEVCDRITDGTHQSPQWSTDGVPFLFVSNIVEGEIDFNVSKYITEDCWKSLTARCPIELNDILYTTVGSYGNAALVRTTNKFCFQRHIAHIKPNHEKVNPEFLLGLMQSPGIKNQADRQARGVAQKTLNLRELKNFGIFVPPRSEQDKYVAIRRKVEGSLISYRDCCNTQDYFFNSLLQKAFRGEL